MEYDKRLFDSLQAISNKVDDLNKQLEVAQLPITSITDINKQLSRFNPISVAFLAFKKIIEEAKAIENNLEKEKDQQILELMRLELDELKTKATNMQEELKILLIPKDPNDEKNVIIEIRPAAGGDESSIFTADLFEVYKRYFLKQK
jgi:peptide chain release factor 1